MELYHDTFPVGKYKGLIDTRVLKCYMSVNAHRDNRPCQYCRYIPLRPLPLRLEFKETIPQNQSVSYNENTTNNLLVKPNKTDQLSQLICDLIDQLSYGKLNTEPNVNTPNTESHSISKLAMRHKASTQPALICQNSYSKFNDPYFNEKSYSFKDYTKKCILKRTPVNVIERHLGISNYTRK
jgi:hypothetical protein